MGREMGKKKKEWEKSGIRKGKRAEMEDINKWVETSASRKDGQTKYSVEDLSTYKYTNNACYDELQSCHWNRKLN